MPANARSLTRCRAPNRKRTNPPYQKSNTDYGFDYSDEEPEEADVDIENQYYNSKGERRLLF